MLAVSAGAQDHQQRRRKHSQIDITSNEAEELRQSSLASCDSNSNPNAKRQCLENAAAPAQAVDMPTAPANDGHSSIQYAQKDGGGPTTALRLRGGGPTASESTPTVATAPAARRTRAAAAAASSSIPASASASGSGKQQARPPPPRPQPSRPAGGSIGSASSVGGTSDTEERAPLLGTPRVPGPNAPTGAALVPIPPAPRRPAAAAARSNTGAGVAAVAAAASDSAAGGGGDAPSEPNANAQSANDNNNNDNTSDKGNGNGNDSGGGGGDGSGGGGGGGDGGNNNIEERPPTVAVLNIRCPVPPPPSQKPLAQQLQFPGQQQPQQPPQNMNKARPMPRDGPIVKVLVPSSGDNAMTERQLGRCIVQATGIGIAPPTADGGGWGWHWDMGYDPYVQYGRTGGTDGNDGSVEAPLAGLFRRDGLFMPMSYVLANALALQGELLSITRPVSRPKPPPPPPPPIWPYVAGGLFVASIMAKYGVDWDWFFDVTLFYAELATRFLINLPFQLFNVLVEVPLKETYRHGPSFIGWEGQPLPRICAQVTFHGDEAFWSRNMLECEKIYAAKEAAALHIRKPLLYIAIAAGLFFAIQALVRTNAIRRQYRPDRNMVETYNALNILLRQFNRAGGAMGMPKR